MISILFSRVVIITFGTLYPAYRSFKAVRMKDAKEYMKWMMYWIAFAFFCVGESFADVFMSFWFPFYYELKILLVFYLVSPWTKGSSMLYRKWIHPTLMKHEGDIDLFLDKTKAETYNHAVNAGRRCLCYAREIVAAAAVRGQAHLAEQVLQLADTQPQMIGSSTDVEMEAITTTTTTHTEQYSATLPRRSSRSSRSRSRKRHPSGGGA